MAGAPDPVPVLMAGSAIVGQVLSPAGFAFQVTGTGRDGDPEEFRRARHAAAEWLRTKPRLL